MAGFKTTFGEWAVRLRTKPSPASIVVSKKKKDYKPISVDRFEEMGYTVFPKTFRELINSEVKFGTRYDKFVDKFYEWWDEQ